MKKTISLAMAAALAVSGAVTKNFRMERRTS